MLGDTIRENKKVFINNIDSVHQIFMSNLSQHGFKTLAHEMCVSQIFEAKCLMGITICSATFF